MRLTLTLIAGLALAPAALAQHEHEGHEHQPTTPPPATAPAGEETMPGMEMPHEGHQHHPGMTMEEGTMSFMPSSVNLADPMSRAGSGTAWQPDSTPMYGAMLHKGGNMIMLHGAAYPRYTHVGSRRGDDKFDAPNWFMGMLSRPLGANDQIGLHAMLSLDPITEGGFGYPLLFQSGETWRGRALHDRQHPHDLFSELSATYSRRFGENASAYLYLGYPGEPALGAPAFMHRLSAMDDPDAPLSHHWQDSTHITFGVATLGVAAKNVKIEGSAFNGTEPDENRYDFDTLKLNSYSGRLSWNPNADTALQVSHGFIKSPEAHHPGVNVHRTTASLLYNRPLGPDANWSSALIWGRNDDNEVGKTDSYLLETSYRTGANTVYARVERVEKSGHELVLLEEDEDRIFPVNAFTLGYVRDLRRGSGIDTGLGAQITLHSKPGGLDAYYGSGTPVSFQVFFRFRPSLHAH